MHVKHYSFICAIAFIWLLGSCDDENPVLPVVTDDSIVVAQVFTNLSFNQPVIITNAGDGSNRLFVVERPGRILFFDNVPNPEESQVFLDITGRVNDNESEQGLLGLAFHPNFDQNGLFYVYYTANGDGRSVISQFNTLGINGDSNSENILLEIDQPFANHNAGMIAFGQDDFLYIALGDGGGAGDPVLAGQNATTLLGSILRIDVDSPSAGLPYGIPTDNPFVDNGQGFKEEIFAYGFRNPFRFSFDRLTGDLYAGDVGQNRIEEVDLVINGGNYGWNTMEGTLCFSPQNNCDPTGLILPIAEYVHPTGFSITGGNVYRGQNFSQLEGFYFYADFVTQILFRFDVNDPSGTDEQFSQLNIGVSSFGEDEQGEIYMTDFNNGGIYSFVAIEEE